MATKRTKKVDVFQPAAGSIRIQPLDGGRWARLFTPDGPSMQVPRDQVARLVARFDADERTPGWIERDMQADPERWADVLDALVALREEASDD
jgi:hypothetical protein